LGVIAVIGFFIVLPRLLNYVDASTFDIIALLLNCITIAVPPSLPAAMSFGVGFAIDRLKKD
jgi:magnesium-transporting ATPase (P-type)